MYIVEDNDGRTIAICSRLEDARAYTATNLDNVTYTIKENTCNSSKQQNSNESSQTSADK